MRPSQTCHPEDNERFVSELAFREHLRTQIAGAPTSLVILRALDDAEEEAEADDQREFRFEFFFYSKERAKAELLEKELTGLGYQAEICTSAGDADLFLVTGWTTRMRIDDDTVERWSERMCRMGYQFDCNFDGWGTTPSQELVEKYLNTRPMGGEMT